MKFSNSDGSDHFEENSLDFRGIFYKRPIVAISCKSDFKERKFDNCYFSIKISRIILREINNCSVLPLEPYSQSISSSYQFTFLKQNYS
jgi:hypothetical protein